MRWFGRAYGAPYESDCNHAPTPVGEPCEWCGGVIGGDDTGLLMPHVEGATYTERPYHYECHMRGIVGDVFHQLGWCQCCRPGTTLPPDPANVTRRDAARMAVKLWNMRRDQAADPGCGDDD